MHTSNTKNREQTCGHQGINWDNKGNCIKCARDEVLGEQTFEIKLSVILTKLDKGEYLDEGGVEGAMQAIKTLVLEDVVGEDEPSKARDDKLRQSPPWQRNQLRLKQRQIINPQKEEK